MRSCICAIPISPFSAKEDRAAQDLRRPGRDRDPERAAVQRNARKRSNTRPPRPRCCASSAARRPTCSRCSTAIAAELRSACSTAPTSAIVFARRRRLDPAGPPATARRRGHARARSLRAGADERGPDGRHASSYDRRCIAWRTWFPRAVHADARTLRRATGSACSALPMLPDGQAIGAIARAAWPAPAVHRDAGRAAQDLCRPGGDRDRERAPVQRDQGGAGAADRHGRVLRVISRSLTDTHRCSTPSCTALPAPVQRRQRGYLLRAATMGRCIRGSCCRRQRPEQREALRAAQMAAGPRQQAYRAPASLERAVDPRRRTWLDGPNSCRMKRPGSRPRRQSLVLFAPMLCEAPRHRHDRRRCAQPRCRSPTRKSALLADLRRPGCDRDRERAAVQRDQGGAGAADRHRRRAAGDQQFAGRRAPVFDKILEAASACSSVRRSIVMLGDGRPCCNGGIRWDANRVARSKRREVRLPDRRSIPSAFRRTSDDASVQSSPSMTLEPTMRRTTCASWRAGAAGIPLLQSCAPLMQDGPRHRLDLRDAQPPGAFTDKELALLRDLCRPGRHRDPERAAVQARRRRRAPRPKPPTRPRARSWPP